MAGKRLDLASVLPIGASSRQRMSRNVALMAQQYWQSLVGTQLNASDQSASDYKKGIIAAPADNDGYTLRLTGFKPNLLERGFGPRGVGSQGLYDVRKFLLKNKMYKTVPFKYTAGQIEAEFGGEAKAAAESLVTKFEKTRSNTDRPIRLSAGLTPNRRPENVQVQRSAWHKEGPKSAVFHKHASDPLKNVMRQTAGYSAAGGTGDMFTAFRRASWRGKAWMSRGVRARRLNDKVRGQMQGFVDRVVRQWRA